MALSPYVFVSIEGTDLRSYTISCTYENSIVSDSFFSIELEGDLLDLYNDNLFDTGKVVSVVFGYLAGQRSSVYVGVISEVTRKYTQSSNIKLSINVIDKGTVLKEGENTKVWNNTLTEICEQLALKYGMKSDLFVTSTKRNIPQGGRNDFEFIQYLITLEDNGNLIFYIKDNVMYLKRRGIDQESVISYIIGEDDRVLNFTPSTREIQDNKESEIIETTSINPADNSITTNILDTLIENISLGTFANTFQSGSFQEAKKQLLIPNYEQIEVNSIVNGIKKQAQFKHLIADLTLIGDPLLEPDAVITIKGRICKVDLGNWYVEKVIQRFSQSDYTTILKLAKNASLQQTEGESGQSSFIPATEPINNSVGSIVKEDKVIINVYSPDGVLIGQKTESGVFIPVK